MHREVPLKAIQFALILATGLGALAQEPINDNLKVTLPHTTWVGSQSLAPGTYRIRQLPTASSPRLLEFSSEDGTKMEIAITTIAAIKNNAARDTSVTLDQRNGQYHLTHVWIAGKTYGYQLPIDDSRMQASAAKSESVTLAGTFTPNQQAPARVETADARPAETPKQEPPQQVAQAQPQPTPAPVEAPAAAPQPPPAPTEPPAVAPQPVPDSTEPPAVAPQPVPDSPRTPAATETPSVRSQNTDSNLAAQTPPMPSTATHWPGLLVGGVVLLLLGLTTRTRHASNV